MVSTKNTTPSDETSLRLALKETKQQLIDTQKRCQDLETQLSHFSKAVEQGPAAVMITDANSNIVYVNRKFEIVSGYSERDIIGKTPSILKSGKTPPKTYEQLWSTITKGKEWSGIFQNRRKNGELFWERAVISGVRDATGTISHYIGVKEDITKEKEFESKLDEEKLKFFHQSKMAEVGLLASSILHEVSNPIASIRGLILEIMDTVENNNILREQLAPDNLELILEQADRLASITHDISDFTSPQSGDQQLIDLNSVIRSTCHLIQFDKRWRNINLILDLDKQIPALIGIKDQLTHLLINLLVNAADAVESNASKALSITVRTICVGDNIHLSVIDNGCGMNSETQEHAFDPFYTTKLPGHGTGLGLSLSHSIVEAHQGSIEIDSTVNKGSEMRVILPTGARIREYTI